MIAWGVLREKVRFLLKEAGLTPSQYRISDTELAIAVGWALDALCAHTCAASATGFALAADKVAYEIPNNFYEPLDKAGLVYLDYGGTKQILEPVSIYKAPHSKVGFYLMPQNTINLLSKPSGSGTLEIVYYARYNHPVFDTDIVAIPPWAESAVCYRTAAHALSPLVKGIANIRQYGQKPDTGAPTDSPLADLLKWYLEMYDREISMVPAQRRELGF